MKLHPEYQRFLEAQNALLEKPNHPTDFYNGIYRRWRILSSPGITFL